MWLVGRCLAPWEQLLVNLWCECVLYLHTSYGSLFSLSNRFEGRVPSSYMHYVLTCFLQRWKLCLFCPGNVLYDFFMGRELNPRVFGVDLKFVCELRPGLIGWVMLNLVFVARACKIYNGAPSPALLMVAGFQIWYVLEALWFEVSEILSPSKSTSMCSLWPALSSNTPYFCVLLGWLIVP